MYASCPYMPFQLPVIAQYTGEKKVTRTLSNRFHSNYPRICRTSIFRVHTSIMCESMKHGTMTLASSTSSPNPTFQTTNSIYIKVGKTMSRNERIPHLSMCVYYSVVINVIAISGGALPHRMARFASASVSPASESVAT
ncbi:hypothetical protein L210DRAFT_727372 [Boletus edulis BED1]|uniref:Uncharacterized protein n=1 Tax=Boletus edulis BED1 TaxID=1328754 RepID=A0AAD4BZA5_BOLED|nr:hypothetical protein L210DRAFT_727372 [Boletus edulis BED1]